ncbi:putative fungal specific transcription factor protein [Neofusicoccum parvum UCRNP2]|uniref:Putative fungal specific transcription factor protein n=1 Tax=Botryosphaeria parva (strain UCR-NP2) TaxID=1287680 RepID=R1GHH0_BOTPV|nr:putative fungal specific transcription factor protein [Neofusicoccum parvum UCRNP2]
MLSRAYFDNIHPQYPFLHRDTFQSWETEVMDAKDAGDLGIASHLTLFFVLMVYAIGSLITTRGGYDAAETYYTAAQEHIEHVLQMDSVESIQAILCCAMYSIRSPVGASVWRLSGMALRHCVELGYHRHIRRPRPARDFLTAEMTKRVFWVAYDMDRAAAFTLGRPFGIMDKDIDAGLPLDVDDSAVTHAGLTSQPRSSPSDPPTSMSGAIHIIRLRRIWSKIHENLYHGISSTANAGHQRDVTKEIRRDLDSCAINKDGSLYPQTAGEENTQEEHAPSELLTMDDWMTGIDMTDFPGGMEWLLENASG